MHTPEFGDMDLLSGYLDITKNQLLQEEAGIMVTNAFIQSEPTVTPSAIGRIQI